MADEHIFCKMCLWHVQKFKKALDKWLAINFWRIFLINLTIWVQGHLRKMSGTRLDLVWKIYRKIPSNIVCDHIVQTICPKICFQNINMSTFSIKYAFANSNPHKLAQTWTGAFVLCYFWRWWTGPPLVLWDVAELRWTQIFPPPKWSACPWAGSCGWAVSCFMEFTLLSSMSASMLSTLK